MCGFEAVPTTSPGGCGVSRGTTDRGAEQEDAAPQGSRGGGPPPEGGAAGCAGSYGTPGLKVIDKPADL